MGHDSHSLKSYAGGPQQFVLYKVSVSLASLCVVCYDLHVFELYICKRHLFLVIFQSVLLTQVLAHLLSPIYCFLKDKN